MNSSKRIYEYDIYRILVTLLVVLGHINFTGLVDRNLGYWGNTFVSHQGSFLDWIYSFHMPAFAFLSGMIYNAEKYISFDKLLITKFKRLLIPYFCIGLFILFPLKTVLKLYSISDLLSLFNQFITGQGESEHLWFLLALFWCFVLFYFPCKYVFGKSVLGGGITIFFIARYITRIDFDLYLFRTGTTYLLPFSVGYIFNYYYAKWYFIKKEVQIIYSIIYITLSILNFYYYDKVLNIYLLHYAGIFFLICIANILKPLVEEYKQKVMFLSDQTFAIYLLHVPIVFVFDIYIKTKLASTLGMVIYFIICLGILITGPILLNIMYCKLIQNILVPKH